ncbi:MAG: hypothetical protein CVU44_12130 [Chloroflexi bacterium HGW-Chloroflexi-6]|nr:MAG: hypothetical protein CVU44_12130 [Chloroflexi bacterium HGW-Chloroflexi-6]
MQKAIKVLVSLLLMMILIVMAIPASAQAPKPEEEIAYHNLTGMARFIGATSSGRPIEDASALASRDTFPDAALSFLAQRGGEFGLKDAGTELNLLRETESENGNHAIRYQQTYQGIPVLAGELIVHLDPQKNILSANGEILPGIDLDTTAGITASAAAETARQLTAKYHELDVETLQASQPELWIYNPALLTADKGETSLVWLVEVAPAEGLYPVRQLVLVDAQRGSTPLTFNQISNAKNRLTYNAGGGTNLPGSLVCNEGNPNCTGGSADAIAAHRYAGHTYDFYLSNHGRDSINGAGMALISTVNYDINYENAFWSGTQMVYGAGFSSADDVVAHELTHGVTEYESNLFYYWQSGAINESLSDVWGEFVDLSNSTGTDTPGVRWLMGEDLPVAIGVIRSMQDPTIYGDPDKMTSVNYYTGNNDNGGVHWNSGVNNKAVFLMVDGGTFNSQTISGLGITKVAKIYYYVQTNLLTSGSDYSDLYYAVQTACTALTGTAGITSGDCSQVKKALDAVEMSLQPVAGYNPDVAACTSPRIPLNAFFDSFESGAANWLSGATAGSDRWLYGSPYGDFAHSGTGFLYADDYPGQVADTFVRMKTSVVVPVDGKLIFQHAYAFEYTGSTYYDGGVLEYSLNNGTTWVDAAPLIEFNGYDSAISSGYSNPLGGRQGFTGISHGYISTRLNLASLAGQSIMFRWRMGLDTSGYTWGWWLDDAQLYECVRFTDVPHSYWAFSWIEKLADNNITGGCGNGNYCPTNSVTRAQMAVFLLKSIHGSSYTPPAVGASTGFADVPTNYWAAAWIKQLAAEGITGGCGEGNYCPDYPVTRAQMAVFLLKSKYGSAHTPPAVGGSTGFGDVPTTHWAAAWVKELAAEDITGGCGNGNYCPEASVTRAQMAVFLIKTFNLP